MTSHFLHIRLFGPALAAALLLPPAAASGPAWPASNRESDGVLWFWGTQTLTGEIVDADGNWAREGEALLRDQARPVWFRGAAPNKGYIESADVGPALARTLAETSSLHLEAALHPPAGTGETLILFQLKTFENDLIWRVTLRDQALWIERPETDPVRLTGLILETPVHLAFTLTDEHFTLRLNGAEHAQGAAESLLPVFEDPWDVIAAFGGTSDPSSVWTGAMEYLLIGTVPHAVEKHAAAWSAAHSARTPPETRTVTATLHAHALEPKTENLSEYGEALLATVWTLDEPLGDDLAAGDRFFAWHWYVLDTRVFPETRPPEVGTRQTLTLSPADGQPQLEGIQQIVEGIDPDDLLMLPDFFLPDFITPTSNSARE